MTAVGATPALVSFVADVGIFTGSRCEPVTMHALPTYVKEVHKLYHSTGATIA